MEFPMWVMHAFPPPATQPTYLFRGKCPVENIMLRAWFDNDLSAYAKCLFFSMVTYTICVSIYRLKFSPLAKFPGPRLWALSRLPFVYHRAIAGDLLYKIDQLHDKYGTVVRLAPDELSFISEAAWNDIYVKVPNKPQLQKSPFDFFPPLSGVIGLGPYPLPDKEHARIRKHFVSGFSSKALVLSELVLQKYIAKLISELTKICAKPVNILDWLMFATFDIAGDMTFDENFGCLETGKLHGWAQVVFGYARAAGLLGESQNFWPLTPILLYLIPNSSKKIMTDQKAMTKEKLDHRMSSFGDRQDFVQGTLKSLNTPQGITYEELLETCISLIIGGADTTSTVLAAIIFFLGTNHHVYTLLTDEIRNTFADRSEITAATASKLEYLTAVINEGLRLNPPVPEALRRLIPKGGWSVDGNHIPEGIRVAVDSYAAGHSKLNFTRPAAFCPERWLSDPPTEFRNDNLQSVQPFSLGPRGCPGKVFAYMEVQLIMAHLIYAFDIQLPASSKNWLKKLKVFAFFEKTPFMVKITPVAQ